MPFRLDVKKHFFQRSDRVKGVDLHPTEPWLLANLYSGHVYIWNYNDGSVVKTFEVTELPVRTAKFVARKQWVVTGADDMYIRVYNHNTMEKIKAFEAHTDYIRCIAVHPVMPYILSSSDDMLIKLWDWEKGWACTQIFEGHSHYVMQCVFNPKDTNTFASASLDRTVKVWSVGQPTPNFTLEGHEKGVNCVDYFVGGDRPFLISGADDRLAKVWDYQTKACVQTLEGHAHNVSAVMFHPELPIILTGSEDGSVRLWHSTTYRLESTLNYGLERVWALCYTKGSNSVGMGFDDGAVVIKIGREEPVASMDGSGKVIWARHNEIQTVNIKALSNELLETDGERLPLPAKDLGSCDLYPQTLSHNPNGRFVTVCGDGEYIIYTALAWRNKSFGVAEEFVWGDDSSVYATRESSSVMKIFKNFKEVQTIKPTFAAERIFGGALLGVAGADFICFYDWNSAKVIRRIDVSVKEVHWSDSGELVAILSAESFYVLRFVRDVVDAFIESGQEVDEDGIDDAFDLLNEVSENVQTGLWVGDCYIYNNSSWRLNYCVGGEVTTMFHLDRPMYILGYLASQSRIYLIDKEYGIVGYTLLMSLIEYKTLVMREDLEAADQILPTIPKGQMNSVAKFLESRGMPERALEVATEPDYRFELAVQLGRLDDALTIAGEAASESKWKQLGELAMSAGKLEVAEHCLKSGKDLSGLLLLYSARGSVDGMRTLTGEALEGGKNNVAFLARFLLGDLPGCVDLLIASGRTPEAAFFARTYLPSRVSEVVALWRADLMKINPKAAESLADPGQYANLFPNMDLALQAEQLQAHERSAPIAASEFASYEGSTMVDLIESVRNLGIGQSEEAGEQLPEVNGSSGNHAEEEEEEDTLEQDFLEEDEDTAEEATYAEPADPAADFLEPELAPPPTSVPLAAVPPPQGQPVEEAPYADAEDGADDYFDEELGEEDLALDDGSVEIDDDWGNEEGTV